jgi:hypothetical protein
VILKNIANLVPLSTLNRLSHPKTPKKDQKGGTNKKQSHQRNFFWQRKKTILKNKTIKKNHKE